MTDEIQPWPFVDPKAFETAMRELGVVFTTPHGFRNSV